MAWDAETRAAYVELMGPTWVTEVETNGATWTPSCTPTLERRDTHDGRVRWDWMCDVCTRGAVYPQLDGTWDAVPFQGGERGTPVQNFSGLEAAMAHVEAHGTT